MEPLSKPPIPISSVSRRSVPDRVLRWIVITPDMYRVRYSDAPPETNSNFGFNLPWLGPPVRSAPTRRNRTSGTSE